MYPHPNLPPLDVSGWRKNDTEFTPITCLIGPAPTEVLELVKCNCTTGCADARCSCVKNELNCTPLCKCYGTSCTRFATKSPEQNDVDENSEENESDLPFTM